MLDVTRVTVMHSGYGASAKSVHMFPDLWGFDPWYIFGCVIEVLFASGGIVIAVRAED